MNIRLTSSLTLDDENVVAPALLKAFTAILDVLPVAYSIRIDTTDGHVFQHAEATSTSPPLVRHPPSPKQPV